MCGTEVCLFGFVNSKINIESPDLAFKHEQRKLLFSQDP